MLQKILAGPHLRGVDSFGSDPFGLRHWAHTRFIRRPALIGTPHPEDFDPVFEQLNRATHLHGIAKVTVERPMPDNTPIPPYVHAILLGNSLEWFESYCRDVRSNLQSWQHYHPETTTVLWTDLTDGDAGYSDMQTWCREHNIKLVDLYDVFSGDETLMLWQPFLIEIGKRQYGAASDILRYAILWRFGGLYADLDDRCTARTCFWSRYSSSESDPYGVYLWKLENGEYNNSIIAIPPRHLLMQKLMTEILKNYQTPYPLPVQIISPKKVELSRVLHLTGPTVLTRVLKEQQIVPKKPFGTFNCYTHSWTRRPPLPPCLDRDALFGQIITNILFDVRLIPNRLNLSHYQNRIDSVPDSDAFEHEVVTFLLGWDANLFGGVDTVICRSPIEYDRICRHLKIHLGIELDSKRQFLHACAWGNVDLLDRFKLDMVNQPVEVWHEALFLAVRSQHIPTIRNVLALCPPTLSRQKLIEETYFKGGILHLAVETKDVDFVRALIALFPDPQDRKYLDSYKEMGAADFFTAAACAESEHLPEIQQVLEKAGFRNNLRG